MNRLRALLAALLVCAAPAFAQPPRPPHSIGPATRITCDNSAMLLDGDPDNVQECLEALDESIGEGAGIWSDEQGSMVNDEFVGTQWTTCDLDDCPGVADGEGADPNPFPVDMSSIIRTGVFSAPFVYTVDPIHFISSFNHATSSSRLNDTLYAAQLQIEYGYDNSARSGAELIEWNWDISPATHLIAINSDIDAASGSSTVGDLVTFSNGAICRPSATTALPTAGARFTCMNGTAPADNNTITSCTPSGCDGTVNGTPTSERDPFRAWAFHWSSASGFTSLGILRKANSHWLSFQGGASTAYLGWDGDASTAALSVNLPATTSNPFMNGAGAVAVDITNASTIGGQLSFHDGTAKRALAATKTQCFEQTDLDAADDDRVIPLSWRQPVTITAMGCRNQTSTSPGTAATLTLETIAGNAITLDSTLTCVGSATAITWVTTSDSDAALASGGGIRFDVSNTPNPATDEHTICVSYLDTAQ